MLLVTAAKAQPSKSNGIPLTKADLLQREKLSDFAPAFPKGSLIGMYEVVCRVGGKVRTITGRSDTLSKECKNAFQNIDLGSNLYVDVAFKIGNKSFADTRLYKIIK